MSSMPLAIVTATSDLERARPCLESWIRAASGAFPIPMVIVRNGGRPMPPLVIAGAVIVDITRQEFLGSVPAFSLGCGALLGTEYEVIACLHDDFEILESGWDQKVLRAFRGNPQMGLAGFGGALALGAEDMYRRPYDPMSLARAHFRSNLTDAEVHGVRSLLSEPVACLDGFSQIGRREFWRGVWAPEKIRIRHQAASVAVPPWEELEQLGLIHHLYDSLLGAIAARNGWETWYLPLRATHHGGRTAVGDPNYQAWAKSRDPKGDQGFWEAAHRIGYDAFRDVLPLRL